MLLDLLFLTWALCLCYFREVLALVLWLSIVGGFFACVLLSRRRSRPELEAFAGAFGRRRVAVSFTESDVMTYACEIVDWLDGDTAILDVSFLFCDVPITILQHARIFGINAPEVHSTSPAEKASGLAAKSFALEIAPAGSQATVSPPDGKWRDKYGRLLTILTLPDGRDFAKSMVDARHALPWDGQGQKPI